MSLSIKAMLTSVTLTSLMVSSIAKAEDDRPLIVYGNMNVSLQQNDTYDVNTAGTELSIKKTEIVSNGSRIGIKGSYDLGHNINAFYRIEYQVNTNKNEEFLTPRNQYVGLKGDFGAFSVGRNDTVLKVSQGKVDQFGDLEGDLKTLFYGENRLSQTATYYTPNLYNFRLGVTYIAESDEDQIGEALVKDPTATKGETGVSGGIMYGDPSLKSLPVYIAVAYDSKVVGEDNLRASIQGKIGDFTLGGMFQQQEWQGDTDKYNGYLVSAAYRVRNVDFKVQYQYVDGGAVSAKTTTNAQNQYVKSTLTEANSFSIGGDYFLAKSTKVYGYYTARDYENMDNNDQFFGVGLQHRF